VVGLLAAVASLAVPASVLGLNLSYKVDSKAIPDRHRSTGYKFAVDLPGSPTVLDIDAMVRLRHPRTQQLKVTLEGPDGTRVTLSRRDTRGRNFGSGVCKDPPQAATDFPDFLPFDDEGEPLTSGSAPYAGGFEPSYDPSFRPRQPLSAFDGSDGEGAWRLRVGDVVDGKRGVLKCARLAIDH
jgi:subtilisin-like proprotein convertase family protein